MGLEEVGSKVEGKMRHPNQKRTEKKESGGGLREPDERQRRGCINANGNWIELSQLKEQGS